MLIKYSHGNVVKGTDENDYRVDTPELLYFEMSHGYWGSEIC